MNRILFILCLSVQSYFFGQTTISGNITDKKGIPIVGANVYLEGTYDGTSTDFNGDFSFSTTEKGIKTLKISFVSFETFTKTSAVSEFEHLKIKLREDVNTLDAVTINAGTYSAGETAKVTALKPLDIVTTAGALGDFVAALQTLPGTSTVDEDGRLFVRGGEAEETQIFIDGIRVFTPYSPSAKNTPTRGRFSPFLFKGISFSTGGFSAEYGQALSSVLLLNTNDEVLQEKTDISLMTVGVGVGNTQVFGGNSLSINASYINLSPYQSAFPDKNIWNKPVQSLSGEAVYRFKFKDASLLKVYGAFSSTDFDLIQKDINYTDGFHFGLKNRNLYVNASYKNNFGAGWKLATGVSFTNDHSDIKMLADNVIDEENSAHFKVALKKRFSNRFKWSFGAEYFSTNFKENYKTAINNNAFKYGFDNNIFGSYTEAAIFFSKKLAIKVGVRGEYSELLKEFTLSPRTSLAYKSGKNTQFSFAYGRFFQNPKNEYLKFNTDFKAENTRHFIANYQYVKNKQILKVEAYYKKYQDLVKYNTDLPLPTATYSNLGAGFAKGIDVFWRDNKNIKNTDYWISYSFLDTERSYKNYPIKATPNFASAHNVSVVAKHWISDWKSQVGLSYNFASGRNYTNPNKVGFLNNKTKNYNSVSANWAYLISPQKILYFSVNNVLGTQNVFGYNYKDTKNMNGIFDRQAITPNADRFFFVGFFWTISDNKKENQLDNL